MGFSDGWKKQSQNDSRRPALHNQLDPDHLTPQDEEQIWWEDTSNAPLMPDAVVGDQGNIGVPQTGGYADNTPQGGDFGMPAFPGFTDAEAIEVRGQVHSEDYGAVAARAYVTPSNRDGSYNVTEIPATDLQGDSPEQNTIRYITGVNGPNDGGNSTPHRQHRRWRDRFIDNHWWGVEMNPSLLKSAQLAPVRDAPTDGNQIMSPYPSGGIWYNQDQFTVPMERRTPPPWDEGMTETGDPVPGSDFGLGSWGL